MSHTPEEMFHQMLGLGQEWRVVRSEFTPEEGLVRLWIEETAALWLKESTKAKEPVGCYDHTRELVWRHLNVFEHRCEIHCQLPRGQIESKRGASENVYRVHPPWEGLSKHFTHAFESMVLLLMRQMPIAAVARHVHENDTRLWRMLKKHIAIAYPLVDWSGVVCVGCDEMSVRKGHHYASVFCDLIGKRVLFAIPGKDSKVWNSFVEELGRHNGHPRAITEVSIDMSPAYITGVKETLGEQALITFDKFHVIAHVNDAVDETRKAEARVVNKEEADLLRASKWILLKNPVNHTDKQAGLYKGILQKKLATVKAHQMRLALQDIYLIADVTKAERKLRAWCRWVRWISEKHLRPIFADMLRCARMIERHIKGILGHWTRRTTNAFLEGLNSVFSAVKRRARGYRSIDNLIAMLYFTAGNLEIPVTHSK